MNLKYTAIGLVMLLSGCDLGPFVESPAMTQYFNQQVSKADTRQVDVVEVCMYDDHVFATVLLKDRLVYHYRMDDKTDAVYFEYMNTPEQRKVKNDQDVGLFNYIGCLHDTGGSGSLSTTRIGYISDYRVEFDTGKPAAFVRKEQVVLRPFDEITKSIVRGAAAAMTDAVEQRKHFVPAQATWGLK